MHEAELERLLNTILNEECIKSSSLKLIYTSLRAKSLYPCLQERTLKKLIEKEITKLKELLPEEKYGQHEELDDLILVSLLEIYNDLFSIHKELVDLI